MCPCFSAYPLFPVPLLLCCGLPGQTALFLYFLFYISYFYIPFVLLFYFFLLYYFPLLMRLISLLFSLPYFLPFSCRFEPSRPSIFLFGFLFYLFRATRR